MPRHAKTRQAHEYTTLGVNWPDQGGRSEKGWGPADERADDGVILCDWLLALEAVFLTLGILRPDQSVWLIMRGRKGGWVLLVILWHRLLEKILECIFVFLARIFLQIAMQSIGVTVRLGRKRVELKVKSNGQKTEKGARRREGVLFHLFTFLETPFLPIQSNPNHAVRV